MTMPEDADYLPWPIDVLERYSAGELEDLELRTALDQQVAADAALADLVDRLRENLLLAREMHDLSAANDVLPATRRATPLIAGHRIIRELHRGGQGIVFEALHEATGRHVAVKVLLHGRFATTRQQARFRRECRLAASLTHPSIATVYESLVAEDGQPGYSMQLIDGEPFDTWSGPRDGELPRDHARRVVTTMSALCEAVAYAHRRAVLHRDLKPSNILVTSDGVGRILDFGLARATNEDDATSAMMTRTGEFIGTLAYSAPEQLLDHREQAGTSADIWALGVMLYEALTGARPFRADGPIAETISAITAHDPPRPSARCRHLDTDIDAVVMTCLEKLPSRRYGNVDDLAWDLSAWLERRPLRVRSASQTYVMLRTARRHWAALTIIAAVMLMIAGASVVMTWLAQAAWHAEEQALELAESRQHLLYESQVHALLGALEAGNLRSAEDLLRVAGDRDDPRIKWARQRFFRMAPCTAVIRSDNNLITPIKLTDDARLVAANYSLLVQRQHDQTGGAVISRHERGSLNHFEVFHEDGEQFSLLRTTPLQDTLRSIPNIGATDRMLMLSLDCREYFEFQLHESGDMELVRRAPIHTETPVPRAPHALYAVFDATRDRLITIGGPDVIMIDLEPGNSTGTPVRRLRDTEYASDDAAGYIGLATDARAQHVLAYRADGSWTIFDADSGARQERREADPSLVGGIRSMQLSGDGALLVVAPVAQRGLRAMRWKTESSLRPLGQPDAFYARFVQPVDMDVLLAHDLFGGISVIDTRDEGRPIRRFHTLASQFCVIALAPSGRTLATGTSYSSEVRLWEIDLLADRSLLLQDEKIVGAHAMIVEPGSSRLIAGSLDGRIATAELGGHSSRLSDRVHSAMITGVAALTNSMTTTCAADGQVALLSRDQQDIRWMRRITDGRLNAIACDPGGAWIAVCDDYGSVSLLNPHDGEVWSRLIAAHESDRIPGIAVIAPGPRPSTLRHVDSAPSSPARLLVAGPQPCIMDVRLGDNGYELHVVGRLQHRHGRLARAVAATPDGSRWAVGFDDGTIDLYSGPDINAPVKLSQHGSEIFCLAFSPDGAQLASGDRSDVMHIWDAATGTRLHGVRTAGDMILSLHFTPDSHALIVSASHMPPEIIRFLADRPVGVP